MPIKYSLPEIERRWLVDVANVARLDDVPFQLIEDRYLVGTHLRLRKIVTANQQGVFKLGKKYGKTSDVSQPITNLYIDAQEYTTLAKLDAVVASKRRYSLQGGSLDVYVAPNAGFAVFEVEFASEEVAKHYTPPGFVGEEITGDTRYSGYALTKPWRLGDPAPTMVQNVTGEETH
jgi:CYTH domain-containing protein